MKETLMKFLTWVSGSMTLAAILKLIPIIFGAAGAIVWFMVAVYAAQGKRLDKQRKAIQVEIAALHLKREQEKS